MKSIGTLLEERSDEITSLFTPQEGVSCCYYGRTRNGKTTAATSNYSFALFTSDKMNKLADIKTDHGDNKNLWDIVMPFFNIVVWLSVFFVIVQDLIGLELSRDRDYEGKYVGGSPKSRGSKLTFRESLQVRKGMKNWDKSETL